MPLDRRPSQLKSTSSGRYRLPYFIYTGLFFSSSRPASTTPVKGRGSRAAGVEESGVEEAGVEEAGVEEVSLV